MSTYLTTDKTGTLLGLRQHSKRIFAILLEAIQRLARELIAYRALRRAEAELMALDDRMLKDIGFDRSEIGSVLTDRSGERLSGVPRKRGRKGIRAR